MADAAKSLYREAHLFLNGVWRRRARTITYWCDYLMCCCRLVLLAAWCLPVVLISHGAISGCAITAVRLRR